MKKIFQYICVLAFTAPLWASAQEIPQADAYLFVRDDCSHCQDLEAFLDEKELEESYGYDIYRIDIKTEQGAELFNEATATLQTGKVTPIGLLNGRVYVGYSEEVLGQAILEHAQETDRKSYPYQAYLDQKSSINNEGKTCEEGSLEPCAEEELLTIPVLGEVDPQAISLTFLATTLGFVDGFNPCAMWVLLTFLLILSQLGDKRKMIQVAGLFIVAEAVMYFLILNVWYQTWDFIALDGIVTPLVGALALGSGSFFVYKYYTSRNKALTCEVTSVEHQQKTEQRIYKLVNKPMSIAVAFAVIGLALSVNIIEFACSVGIPQAFTKILEINNLSFFEYQWYTLLYTLWYMADDVIVFGLAIWGYNKFYAVGAKYSRYATLVAGLLMLALGALLVFYPDILSM